MRPIIYRCKGLTEATDRANLYYINVTAARGLNRDRDLRTITATGRNGQPIAIFTY